MQAVYGEAAPWRSPSFDSQPDLVRTLLVFPDRGEERHVHLNASTSRPVGLRWGNIRLLSAPLAKQNRSELDPNAVGQHGTDHALIGGVVAVVVFVTLCLIIVLGRYLARHKGTYLTNEAKGADDAPDADTAIINAEGNHAHTEEKKEYFI
ncbi:Cell adhesion molecule 2 [Takifugu flavidus]|uniref:Cell adhesion molecule 2 n=1 Tax=Takifugu flavidus TaxID=433684 RepID=A0A5C6P5L4_9TELE|nr:Cell adhesion molecule 2 [Takifugu flavidus]